MSRGKYSKSVARKPIALLLALTMILGVAVGGTIAWLTAATQEVENTFTVGNIDIDLQEDAGGTEKEFKMIPGHTIEKDPEVSVEDGSEDCWLFVEITESATLDTYINYGIAAGWDVIDDGDSDDKTTVIARKVLATDEDKDFEIIGYTDGDEFVLNKVLVKNTVTKDNMDDLNETNAVQPTLSFKAYAVQLYKTNGVEFTAADAWALAKS